MTFSYFRNLWASAWEINWSVDLLPSYHFQHCIEVLVRVGNKLSSLSDQLVSFSMCLWVPGSFLTLSNADPVWKRPQAWGARALSPPGNRLLPSQPLGCLCRRHFHLQPQESWGSWWPRVRHTFWEGPERSLLYQELLTCLHWLCL